MEGWMIGSIVLSVVLSAGLSLLPVIINWTKTQRCPKCGKWFCLEFHSFVVTDKTIGHHRMRRGGGYRGGLKGGFYNGVSNLYDNPFIREWGEARYICRACGRHVSIMTYRDR